MSEPANTPNIQASTVQAPTVQAPTEGLSHTASTPPEDPKEQAPAYPAKRSWSKPGHPGNPPIEVWEQRLVGKKLISEDATGDDTTFKWSELPETTIKHGIGATDFCWRRNRLNVRLNKQKIVEFVYYA